MIQQNYEKVIPVFTEEVVPNVVITAHTEFMLNELKKMFNDEHPDVGCQFEGE
ncbi:MAG TPA: hypothetical protein VFM18_24220 [Methanosarcina sp.]|nr:hypothetical protein [Methanosarcina sp.]